MGPMKKRRQKQPPPWRWLLAVWGVAMLGLLAATFLPARTELIVLPFGPLQALDGRSFEMPGRTLEVTWPAFLRVGESSPVEVEVTPGGQPEGLSMTAAARLDLPALAGQPAEAGEILMEGAPVRFAWDVLTSEAGVQKGLLWLSIWVEGGEVPGQEIAVMARPVQIPVRNPLGWRITAGVGLLLGAAGAFALRRFDR